MRAARLEFTAVPRASHPTPLTLKVERADGDFRVGIRGDLDHLSAGRLDRLLERLGDIRGRTLVLDFGEVVHVDSSGLTAIVAVKLRGDREGFGVRLEHVPDGVQRMLSITGLDRLLRR